MSEEETDLKGEASESFVVRLELPKSERKEDSTLDKWVKSSQIFAAVLIPLILAGITLLGSNIQTIFTYKSSSDSIKRDFVQMAIGILSKPKSPDDKAMREWAAGVLDKTGPIPLGNLQQQLIEGQIDLPSVALSGIASNDFDYYIRIGKGLDLNTSPQFELVSNQQDPPPKEIRLPIFAGRKIVGVNWSPMYGLEDLPRINDLSFYGDGDAIMVHVKLTDAAYAEIDKKPFVIRFHVVVLHSPSLLR